MKWNFFETSALAKANEWLFNNWFAERSAGSNYHIVEVIMKIYWKTNEAQIRIPIEFMTNVSLESKPPLVRSSCCYKSCYQIAHWAKNRLVVQEKKPIIARFQCSQYTNKQIFLKKNLVSLFIRTQSGKTPT